MQCVCVGVSLVGLTPVKNKISLVLSNSKDLFKFGKVKVTSFLA